MAKKSNIKKALRGAFLKDRIKFMSKTSQYFKDIKAELKHVNWPGRKLTIMYTLVVIVLSVLLAYFLGIFDFLFSLGLGKIIGF